MNKQQQEKYDKIRDSAAMYMSGLKSSMATFAQHVHDNPIDKDKPLNDTYKQMQDTIYSLDQVAPMMVAFSQTYYDLQALKEEMDKKYEHQSDSMEIDDERKRKRK